MPLAPERNDLFSKASKSSSGPHYHQPSSQNSRKFVLLGLSFAIAIGVVGGFLTSQNAPIPTALQQPTRAQSQSKKLTSKSARSWYSAIRSSCNAVEVDFALRKNPPPSGDLGASYAAACLVLAGNTEAAREKIESLKSSERPKAALLVFNQIHPIADKGNDAAALPGMLLTIDYMPKNFQALYHAGLAEAQLGRFEDADEHLTKFLELYSRDDSFTRRGKKVLENVQSQLRDIERTKRWEAETSDTDTDNQKK